MKFNEEEVFPGTKVKLSLKASPGSLFAISAVDKSVHFLGNANDISRSRVRYVYLGEPCWTIAFVLKSETALHYPSFTFPYIIPFIFAIACYRNVQNRLISHG